MELHTIKITPQDVDIHIKTAIINSAIGEALTKAIQEKLRGWEFDKAVKTVLDEEIPKIIRGVLLEPDKREMVTKSVREALTEPLVINIANKTIEHLWK